MRVAAAANVRESGCKDTHCELEDEAQISRLEPRFVCPAFG